MNSEAIIAKLKAVPGNVGFYYKDLTTGETLGYNENEQFEAASVIKLPVYMVIMKLAHEGKLSLGEKLICRHADKMPPCGALYFFTDEPVVDIENAVRADDNHIGQHRDQYAHKPPWHRFPQRGIQKDRP